MNLNFVISSNTVKDFYRQNGYELKPLDAVYIANQTSHTRNGHGAYTIMTVAKADELDKLRAARALANDLKRAEERANREGWIDADDFDREMGIID